MIKSIVLKNFHDVKEGRLFKKNGTHFTKSLKRAEELANKGFIKVLEIEKQAKKDESELTLKELREKYPDIKASSKKDFLSKI